MENESNQALHFQKEWNQGLGIGYANRLCIALLTAFGDDHEIWDIKQRKVYRKELFIEKLPEKADKIVDEIRMFHVGKVHADKDTGENSHCLFKPTGDSSAVAMYPIGHKLEQCYRDASGQRDSKKRIGVRLTRLGKGALINNLMENIIIHRCMFILCYVKFCVEECNGIVPATLDMTDLAGIKQAQISTAKVSNRDHSYFYKNLMGVGKDGEYTKEPNGPLLEACDKIIQGLIAVSSLYQNGSNLSISILRKKIIEVNDIPKSLESFNAATNRKTNRKKRDKPEQQAGCTTGKKARVSKSIDTGNEESLVCLATVCENLRKVENHNGKMEGSGASDTATAQDPVSASAPPTAPAPALAQDSVYGRGLFHVTPGAGESPDAKKRKVGDSEYSYSAAQVGGCEDYSYMVVHERPVSP